MADRLRHRERQTDPLVDLVSAATVLSWYHGGRAVVVNGPSGAGKSTLLESLQRSERGLPWVILDEPDHIGSVCSEYRIWRERAPTLQEGFLGAIGALAAAGNLVAVAAGGHAQSAFERHLHGTPVVWVGLYCDRDVLLARERSRADRWGGLAESSMSSHDDWHYDLTFDTSHSPDPAELASDILREVEDNAAGRGTGV